MMIKQIGTAGFSKSALGAICNFRIIWLSFFSVAFAVVGSAQSEADQESWSERQSAEIIEALLDKTGLPGLSIAVRKHDDLIYARGFGFSDVQDMVKMTPETHLRAASVSKVLTATALGRLATQGQLNFDDQVQDHISGISERHGALTIRQLAGHTSGMVHRAKGSEAKKVKGVSEIQRARTYTSKLLFEPDTEYQYSTHAFNLLAAVIESASQKGYAEYMIEEIFVPLGMLNTLPEDLGSPNQLNAKLYYLKKDKLKQDRRPPSGTAKLAGAGFRTTPTDLCKLMEAYENGFIASDIVHDMFESQVLKNGKLTQVGIAWRSSVDIFGHRVIEHAGNWLGARSVIVYYPEEELSISVMINASCQVFIEETAHLLAQLFRSQSATPSSVRLKNKALRTEIALTDGSMEKYTGKISLQGDRGLLKVDRLARFINTNRFFYLGSAGDYGMVTSFGVLHFSISPQNTPLGVVQMYGTQNEKSPKNQPPVVTLHLMPTMH